MKKLTIFLCVLLLALSQAKAQPGFPDTSNYHSNCGLTAEKLMTMGVLINNPNIPTGYPAAGIIPCGKFMVYYDDVAYTTGGGFDEPGGIGTTRRNTLCSVLTYVQSVYDFSTIPSGQYIRLHVDSSYTHVYHADDPRQLAFGAPFFNRPLAPGSVNNGFVYDYIKTGSDPMPGNWHGEIRVNFDTAVVFNGIKWWTAANDFQAVDFQNGLGTVQSCQYDLYSILLHMVSHTLGYYGMVNIQHGGVWSPGVYTSLDTSLRIGGAPYSSPTWTSAPLTQGYLSGLTGFWLDNSPVPYRSMMLYAHFTDIYRYARVGSGKRENFVMCAELLRGAMNRQYTKEELKIGNKILGYAFDPTAFSGSSASALYYNNRRPWCSKNFDYYEGLGYFDSSFHYFDTTRADFTMTNNVGASLVINLASDTSLHDDDGDILQVVPSSLVNIRGCGINGNNHNALALSNANKTITYSPRANFYGRAQFLFTVSDAKEEGTMRMYTVDVRRGTNVNVASGDNLVLNGDHEQGTEVKMLDSFEQVPNAATDAMAWHMQESEIRDGAYFSDAHPYSNPVVIRNSRVECSEAHVVPYSFGNPFTSFPWAWSTLPWGDFGCVSGGIRYPEAPRSVGNRYAWGEYPSLYNLGDSVRKCHSYQLEFDAIRTILSPPPGVACWDYPAIDTITIGFTNGSYLVKTTAKNAYKYYPLTDQLTDKLNSSTWTHFSFPFAYCGDSAFHILYIRIAGTFYAQKLMYPRVAIMRYLGSSLMIDNVSLKEIHPTVKIMDTLLDPCIHRLTAKPNVVNSCRSDLLFTWTTLSGKTVGTGPVIDVSPASPTKYIVTMNNGCESVRDTITLQGIYCPCGPQDVFGDTAGFYTLRGTISTIPVQPYYYISANTTLTADAQIRAANVLAAPGVELRIADSVKLTLDSAHLFTCPTDIKMWSGIRLASGATKSGRIVVKNNSCIEDALFAIDGLDLKAPLNGNIIDVTNSVFNRNQVDISVNRAYAPSAAGTFPIQVVSNVFTARLFTPFNTPGYPVKWPTPSTLKAWVAPTDAKPSYAANRNYLKSLCKDASIFSYLGVRINTIGRTFGTSSFNEVVIGGGTTADDFNLFDNHAYGVVVYGSNVTLYNNTFTHISRRMEPSVSTTLPVENGMAVVGWGDASRYLRLQLIPYGMNFQNRFHDCYAPVFAQSYSELNIKNTVITSSHSLGQPIPGAAYPTELYTGTGISLMGDGSHTAWTITNNDISNMNAGIYAWLVYAQPGATTVIDKNQVRNANPDPRYAAFTAGQYMLQGIEVFSPASGGVIKTLSVSENVLNNVFSGIYINGLKDNRTTLYKNTVNLWDVTRSVSYTQDGISLTNCYGVKATENFVGTLALGRPDEERRLRGFFAANNTDLKLCSNMTKNTGRGFEFGQWTTQTGVRWISNTMNGGYKAFVIGSEIGDQGLMRNFLGGYYYGAIGNIWIGFSGAPYFQTFVEKDRRSFLAKLYVRNSTSPVERPIVNSSDKVGGGIYPYIYEAPGSIIIENSNTANCDGQQQIGMPKPHPFPTGIAKTLAELTVADSLNYDPGYEFSQWMAQLSIYEMGMLEPDLVSGSQVFTQFMNTAAASRFGWIWNTQKALAEGNLNAAENMLLQAPSAMGRVPVNPDVVITDIHEADYVVGNYQDYFSLYLKFLKGTLDDNGKTALFALAQKCPAVDGAVVYQARGLYRNISGEIINYDDDSCMYGVSNWYKKAPKDQLNSLLTPYTLYPNPNQGSFMIRQTAPTAQQVNVRVYNAIGVQIYQSYSNFTNGSISVQLGNQPQGIYLVCIEDGAKAPTCLRFTIK